MLSCENGLFVVPIVDIVVYRECDACVVRLVAPSWTLSGFHGNLLVISMCLHVDSSSLVGSHDVNESFVPCV